MLVVESMQRQTCRRAKPACRRWLTRREAIRRQFTAKIAPLGSVGGSDRSLERDPSRSDSGAGIKHNFSRNLIPRIKFLNEVQLREMVPLEGESLNTIFDELSDWEEQLKPYAVELEELGL